MTDGNEFINSFAQWQADDMIQNCLNCHARFTFLVRKHHCRCCGGIFCGSCSDKFLWYDKKKIKIVSRYEDDIELPPYRTCNACYENLLRMKLLFSPWGDRLRAPMRNLRRPETPDSNSVPQTASSASSRMNEIVKDNQVIENVRDADSERSSALVPAHTRNMEDYQRCPICNSDLSTTSDENSQKHIQECIGRAEMAQQHHDLNDVLGSPTFQNRMLVYKIPKGDSFEEESGQNYPECPICFEEMLPGDKVGRLECLCVFHYDCIKSWFRKKTQKMKAGSTKFAGKNFCPLHDAVF